MWNSASPTFCKMLLSSHTNSSGKTAKESCLTCNSHSQDKTLTLEKKVPTTNVAWKYDNIPFPTAIGRENKETLKIQLAHFYRAGMTVFKKTC